MCIRQTSTPDSATMPASSGSRRSAVTSFTIDAPGASARRATSAREVSTETGKPASASSTGSTRRSSSSSLTGSAPGRVDSPPTSTSEAPCGEHLRPVSAAASGEAYDPAVGEAVGRDVDDPHHRRPGPTFRLRLSSHPTWTLTRRGGAGRAAAVAVGGAVVALVAVVAIASCGGLPGGGIAERRPSEGLRDDAFSLILVMLAMQRSSSRSCSRSSAATHDRGAPRLERRKSIVIFLVAIVLIASSSVRSRAARASDGARCSTATRRPVTVRRRGGRLRAGVRRLAGGRRPASSRSPSRRGGSLCAAAARRRPGAADTPRGAGRRARGDAR